MEFYLNVHIDHNWVLLGDFNVVLNLDERIGSLVRMHEVRDSEIVWLIVVWLTLSKLVGFSLGPTSKKEIIEFSLNWTWL